MLAAACIMAITCIHALFSDGYTLLMSCDFSLMDCIVVGLQCDDNSAAASGKGARQPRYEVLSVESLTELERKKSSMMLMGLQSSSKSQDIQTPQDADADAEGSGKTWLILYYCSLQFTHPSILLYDTVPHLTHSFLAPKAFSSVVYPIIECCHVDDMSFTFF